MSAHIHPDQKARAVSAGEATRKAAAGNRDPAIHQHPDQKAKVVDVAADGVSIQSVPRQQVISREDRDTRVMDERKDPGAASALAVGTRTPANPAREGWSLDQAVKDAKQSSLPELGTGLGAELHAEELSAPEVSDPMHPQKVATAEVPVEAPREAHSTPRSRPEPAALEAPSAPRESVRVHMSSEHMGTVMTQVVDVSTCLHGVMLAFPDGPNDTVVIPPAGARITLYSQAHPLLREAKTYISLGAGFESSAFGVIFVPLFHEDRTDG